MDYSPEIITECHPELVPPKWRQEIECVLIPARKIAAQVRILARVIGDDYRDKDLVIVSLLNGTIVFLADLIRHLDLPLKLDFMGIASYRSGTEPGELVVTKRLQLDLDGMDVLVVDDILDTGKTLQFVLDEIRKHRPRSIKTCVLLEKPARRVVPISADYVGFRIPDSFVVGYGLDFAERYRNLPFIGVLRQELYGKSSNP